ncbi:tetratricopeptide repeat protein [Sphingorhabdus sp. EL138]|uniref:tetratricopeptide repeat protein n=1 Tax=Sphingorhabdus sp. EL138 TaxID=2073156 RepID=UPI0025CD2A7B|nr:tetratricopeptide repeat protein [Sphingorhabdus sp. EL138]
MNGWIVLGLLSVLSLSVLTWFVRSSKGLWQIAAAAVLLGMTGYALQGRPSAPSSPAKSLAASEVGATQLIDIRADMDQSFGGAKRWLVTADSFAKQGDYASAASYIQSGLRSDPKNPDLWSALGLQLMLASEGQMSPPAQLAFDKARAIQPKHPAPYYFAGLARMISGDLNGGVLLWEKTLTLATPDAKWKVNIETQLKAAKALQVESAQTQQKS